jgi:hypothetical protein
MAHKEIDWDRVDRTRVEVVTLDEADDEVEFWLTRAAAERWAGVEHLRRTYHGDATIDGRLPRVLELVELAQG